MILRRAIFGLGCWFSLAGAYAQTDFLTDHQKSADRANAQKLARFEYVAPVIEGQDAVRKLELPYEVLNRMQRRDRGDIAVFNAAGRPVPSKIFSAPRQTSTQTQQRALAYFPVNRHSENGQTHYSFQFSTSDEHTAINLSPPGAMDSPEVSDYIVHLDREHTRSLGNLVGLQFDWETTDENLLVPLRIEGSGDLQNWKMLNDDAVLSDLQHDGVTLIRNSVKMSSYGGDHLRITWPMAGPQLNLTGITGRFTRHQSSALPRRQITVDCKTQDSPGECLLDVGTVPAETLQLHYSEESPESDHFLQGTLFSRDRADRGWRKRGSIQQYRLTFDGTSISQPNNTLPRNADPLWKVVYDPAMHEPYPERAEIQWRPLYLAFVTQGEGPYKLAFGSEAAASNSSRTVTTLLKRSHKSLADLELVALGPVGQNVVEVDFWTQDRLQTYALWAVLLCGVGVMLWIAIGLFRRMGATDS